MAVTASMRRYMNDSRQLGLSVRARQANVIGDKATGAQETRKYDDLGLIMTGEQYEDVRGQLDASAQQRAEEQLRLAQASEELEASYAEAAGYLSEQEKLAASQQRSIDQLYNEYESGFSTVLVIGETNQNSYRLPKEMIDALDTKVFNQGDGSYTANWSGDTYQVSAKTRGTDEWRGKELDELMSNTQSQIYDKFLSDNASIITDINNEAQRGLNTINSAQADLEATANTMRGNIADSESAIAASEAGEQEILNAAKERFNTNMGAARETATNWGLR